MMSSSIVIENSFDVESDGEDISQNSSSSSPDVYTADDSGEISTSEVEISEEEVESLPVKPLELDEDQALENKEAQDNEKEVMQSIYGEEFGIVTEDSFVVKLSVGRFNVRLQVTYPCTYPSQEAPMPAILGAFWDAFDHKQVLHDLQGAFIPGCSVVYDWTVIIQDHLQKMMDNMIQEDRVKKKGRDQGSPGEEFCARIHHLRLKFESTLSKKDLADTENWVITLSAEDVRSLFHVIKKRQKCSVDRLLKKVKKSLPTITAPRLFWFIAWLDDHALSTRRVPAKFERNSDGEIMRKLWIPEIEMKTKALIELNKNDIYIIGESRQVAENYLDALISKSRLEELFWSKGRDLQEEIEKKGKVLQNLWLKLANMHKCKSLQEYEKYMGEDMYKCEQYFTLISEEFIAKKQKETIDHLLKDTYEAMTNVDKYMYMLNKHKEMHQFVKAMCSAFDVYTSAWCAKNDLPINLAQSQLRTLKIQLSTLYEDLFKNSGVSQFVDLLGKTAYRYKLIVQEEGHIYLSLKNAPKKRSGRVVYHGTAWKNVQAITENGLLVRGGKSTPANGQVYGVGIYTSPNINVPMCYARYGPYVCKALHSLGTWLCIFECVVTDGKDVASGIFLVPSGKDIRIVGLHLYKNS